MRTSDRQIEHQRIIIVDDAPLFRRGLSALLIRAGFTVVGEAAGAGEALRLLDIHAPAVVVADAHLAGVTSVLFAAVMRRRHRTTSVVLVGYNLDREHLLAAACAGVAAVLPRDADTATLCNVIARVARGETPIIDALEAPEDITRTVLRLQYAPTDTKPGASDGAPTPSELLALDCLARGVSEQEASQWACLEPRTLRNHLQRLRARHGLNSRTQLLRFAAAQGWIAPFPPALKAAA
jgi:two-component system, NarL family, nitrate/nitrite response regulator NarL